MSITTKVVLPRNGFTANNSSFNMEKVVNLIFAFSAVSGNGRTAEWLGLEGTSGNIWCGPLASRVPCGTWPGAVTGRCWAVSREGASAAPLGSLLSAQEPSQQRSFSSRSAETYLATCRHSFDPLAPKSVQTA